MRYLKDPIDSKTFEKEFLAPLVPVVFGPWLTKDWKARVTWVKDGKLDTGYMSEKYGTEQVPVTNCDEQSCDETTLDDYLSYLVESRQRAPKTVRYLKDWHLVLRDASFYSTPTHFAADWLNEFCLSEAKSDYRFVYIGPKNSSTPIHRDVLASHSWSSNIVGVKLWHFWKGDNLELIRDHVGRYIEDEKILSSASETVVQKAGETIFVPSGWFHQVKNMEETVSINHNWLNQWAMSNTWTHLLDELALVENEIEYLHAGMDDEQEWGATCQRILRAQTSFDFNDFLYFLKSIERRRSGSSSACAIGEVSVLRELISIVSQKLAQFPSS